MFKCTYALGKDCQLFSWECKKEDCKVYGECHSCRYRALGQNEKPCVRCGAKGAKHGIQ